MNKWNNTPSPKIEAFLKEYGELVEKHGVDYANYPMFVPDGQGGFRILVQTVPVDMDQMKKETLDDFIPR